MLHAESKRRRQANIVLSASHHGHVGQPPTLKLEDYDRLSRTARVDEQNQVF